MGSPSGGTSQGTVRKMEKGVGGLFESSREHFTVVLLANAHPNAYVSCSPILKLPSLYHTTCLLLLIKSLTSFTSRDYQPLQNCPEDCYEGPHQDTEV
jgi:hypothetical protein